MAHRREAGWDEVGARLAIAKGLRNRDGKRLQLARPCGKADWYGEGEALERVARREGAELGLDDDVMEAIARVADRFPERRVRCGFFERVRPDRLDVRIYLLRQVTGLSRKAIAGALGVNAERVHRGVIRGRRLVEGAKREGWLNAFES